MAMNGRRDARLEARWRGLVEEHVSSGLGVREFCRRRKITESAFYFWRGELHRRGRERTGTSPQKYRKKKPEQHERPSAQVTFVPVRLAVGSSVQSQPSESDGSQCSDAAAVAGRVVIELSHGRRVHVFPPVDRQELADVLLAVSDVERAVLRFDELTAPSVVEGERSC
jgi:transposase-like protein